MSQPENPVLTDELEDTLEIKPEDQSTFHDFLRLATAEIQNAIQQGRELQNEINARKAQINAALDQLLKTA